MGWWPATWTDSSTTPAAWTTGTRSGATWWPTPTTELLAYAAELGISPSWLQGSRSWDHHFDLPAPLRPEAVALGAVEVDFRFMGRRTRARRAALSLGADVAVGAPTDTVIEVPLAEGRWRAKVVPDALSVSWAQGHPRLGEVAVARLASSGPASGVIVVEPDGDERPGRRPAPVRIGVVVGGALRSPGRRPDG